MESYLLIIEENSMGILFPPAVPKEVILKELLTKIFSYQSTNREEEFTAIAKQNSKLLKLTQLTPFIHNGDLYPTPKKSRGVYGVGLHPSLVPKVMELLWEEEDDLSYHLVKSYLVNVLNIAMTRRDLKILLPPSVYNMLSRVTNASTKDTTKQFTTFSEADRINTSHSAAVEILKQILVTKLLCE